MLEYWSIGVMTKGLIQTFQEKIPETAVDEWWALMEPVYEL